ncbi:Protein of unknown function [Lactobacillus helveticus CIRM-BIA 101]|uniref:Uncharacterized protein n=1 Tax=Lactobacillus helveticus CIRM-BIA 104 TaxID=1226333 RepID=U6F9E8_LACHE|nr:Protein of unknown function [Lactobacillus helveticus CIRM-BIA 104]CDI66307.1 Protein of unknown function [Lactobacillus helveticus CIRM-BIA 101]
MPQYLPHSSTQMAKSGNIGGKIIKPSMLLVSINKHVRHGLKAMSFL